jgi:hypothetical protein
MILLSTKHVKGTNLCDARMNTNSNNKTSKAQPAVTRMPTLGSHILYTNINNKISKAAPTNTRMTTLNPNCSICCKIRNAKRTNKEKIAPYKRDWVNGVSGNKNTLIMGTSKMGNRIAIITKRHFLSHHFAIPFPINFPLFYDLIYL